MCRISRIQNNNKRVLSGPVFYKLVDNIAPWPDGETTYSVKDWATLVAAAKYIQSCDPASVESTLREFQDETSVDKTVRPPNTYSAPSDLSQLMKRLDDDSKLLLLMRMMFELPDHIKGMEIEYFGWRSYAGHKDGTFDQNWPICWMNGQPKLASGMTSLEGPVDVYNVVGEYQYFSAQYHFRNLNAVKTSTN